MATCSCLIISQCLFWHTSHRGQWKYIGQDLKTHEETNCKHRHGLTCAMRECGWGQLPGVLAVGTTLGSTCPGETKHPGMGSAWPGLGGELWGLDANYRHSNFALYELGSLSPVCTTLCSVTLCLGPEWDQCQLSLPLHSLHLIQVSWNVERDNRTYTFLYQLIGKGLLSVSLNQRYYNMTQRYCTLTLKKPLILSSKW